MGLFTPRQFKKPSEWLRAIPLLQDALKESLPLHLVTLERIRAMFNALETLLLVEERLKKEIQISCDRKEEEPWYPVKLTRYQFGVVDHLLYCQPLSEEELDQVLAGPGARECMGL